MMMLRTLTSTGGRMEPFIKIRGDFPDSPVVKAPRFQ